ncbi:Voltage-gated hydrogen channel 1 [Echinococcus granulosus]|uniref:Voltage-gated hydrogen channel 1 n=1 Tax=Echinococcus granulosus TaxID=6210 RepID=A0A068WJK6_ECHGR|nr:Voltage-gated hydrogen channel 1 [Echinococcus granulosus]CDS17769.1 voltage gated hydrogen channel 1 [Echinococcus granulosus]
MCTRNQYLRLKSKFRTSLHGKAFQFGIITLAGLEGLLVVSMLMLEIERLQSKDPIRAKNLELAKFGIECISLSIISLFLVEIILKLWIFGIGLYLHSLIESIDAVVICVSFAIDIYLMVTETHCHHTSSSSTAHGLMMATTPAPESTLRSGIKSLPEAAGFLVLFRLWRVVRIANAILVSVSATQETKIQELKAERDKAASRVSQLEDFILSLGQDVPSDSHSSPAKSTPFLPSSSSV